MNNSDVETAPLVKERTLQLLVKLMFFSDMRYKPKFELNCASI